MQPVAMAQSSNVQALLSLQSVVAPAMQRPPWHPSPFVHALPSEQAAALSIAVSQPLAALQLSVVQGLLSLQISPAPGTHAESAQ